MQFIINDNCYIQWLLIDLVAVYQEVMILLFLTHWMERCFICKWFMWYSNFVHTLNSQI